MSAPTTTSIATATADDVFIRGKSLCRELIGRVTFTEMLFFQILGRPPTPAQTRVVDACLVTLMEHGLTPSAVAARLVYGSAAEAMQDGEARAIADEHRRARKPVAGFGHPQHRPDDPRSPVLLALARAEGVAGAHVDAVEALGRAVDAASGRHITLNATGAIAALLGDCGVPASILRGFALIARAAGLVGHIHEEQQRPTLRTLWESAEQAVPYDGTTT